MQINENGQWKMKNPQRQLVGEREGDVGMGSEEKVTMYMVVSRSWT